MDRRYELSAALLLVLLLYMYTDTYLVTYISYKIQLHRESNPCVSILCTVNKNEPSYTVDTTTDPCSVSTRVKINPTIGHTKTIMKL